MRGNRDPAVGDPAAAPQDDWEAAAVPHRLAIFWKREAGAEGHRGCTLLVPGGALRLNGSAAAIWERIDGRRDTEAIAVSLRDLYPRAGVDQLRAATRDLLADLARAGAVVAVWTPLDPLPAPRLRAAASWLSRGGAVAYDGTRNDRPAAAGEVSRPTSPRCARDEDPVDQSRHERDDRHV